MAAGAPPRAPPAPTDAPKTFETIGHAPPPTPSTRHGPDDLTPPLRPAQPTDVSRAFTFVGIVCAFLSTFFAHGFLTLARQALNEGKAVKRSFLVSNLVRGGQNNPGF